MVFFHHGLGDPEGFEGGRHTDVDRGLQKRLLDLFRGDPVIERTANVHAEFVGAIEGGQHHDVKQAASLARKAFTTPDHAPDVFGDELLDWTRELADLRDRSIDVFGPEDLASVLQAFLKTLFVGLVRWHQFSPSLGFR